MSNSWVIAVFGVLAAIGLASASKSSSSSSTSSSASSTVSLPPVLSPAPQISPSAPMLAPETPAPSTSIVSSATQTNLKQVLAHPVYPNTLGQNAQNLLGQGVASLVPFEGGLQLRLNSTGLPPNGNPQSYIYSASVTY